MTVRSPDHALAADLSESTVGHVAAGILQIPKLKYGLPWRCVIAEILDDLNV